jgi:hypothetical protein
MWTMEPKRIADLRSEANGNDEKATSALSGLSFGVVLRENPHETLRDLCSRHVASSKVLVSTFYYTGVRHDFWRP